MSVDLDFEEGVSVDSLRNSQPAEGWAHLACSETSDVEGLDGFAASLEILAHEQPGQEKRRMTEKFIFPSGSHKDGGRFCRERLILLWKAAGIVAWDHVGKVNLNPRDLVGMQFIAKIKHRKYTTDKGVDGIACELDAKQIHHVYEDAVANMPKNMEMLQYAQGGPNAAARGAHAPVIGKEGNGVGKYDPDVEKLFDGVRGRGDEPKKEAPKDTPAKDVRNGDGGEDLNDV